MPSNIYTSSTGTAYVFFNNIPTDVKVKEDVEYFRNHPKFEEIGVIKEVKKEVKEKASEVKKKIESRGRPSKWTKFGEEYGLSTSEMELISSYYKKFDTFIDALKKPQGVAELSRLTGMEISRSKEITDKFKGV